MCDLLFWFVLWSHSFDMTTSIDKIPQLSFPLLFTFKLPAIMCHPWTPDNQALGCLDFLWDQPKCVRACIFKHWVLNCHICILCLVRALLAICTPFVWGDHLEGDSVPFAYYDLIRCSGSSMINYFKSLLPFNQNLIHVMCSTNISLVDHM